MSDTSKATENKKSKKKRGARGQGRLYKKKSGKEYSASSNVQGAFYFACTLSSGKRTNTKLLDPDGNPIFEKGKAEKARALFLAPISAGKTVDQLKAVTAKLADAETRHALAIEEANPPLTIANAWEAYSGSTERPDSGDRTLRGYAGHWKRFKDWLEGADADALYLRDVTSKTAQDYAKALQRDKVSPNTYNKHISFMKLFYRVLEEPARMKENPFDRIRKKQLKTNVRRELSIAELKTVLEKAGGELQTLLYLGTFTGLRLGDCCTLKWGEVDLDRGLIKRVPNKTASRKQKPVVLGIPEALYAKLAGTPKSKRKGHVVPKYAKLYTYENREGVTVQRADITDEIQTIFEDCEIRTHKEGTGLIKDPVTGKKESTGKRAVVEVGFHSLRHTYVSLHAERGTPQAVVQAIVGHGNPAMTAHYTHIGEETARQVAGVITLNEPARKGARHVPPWIQELAKTMTVKNWKQIKAELLGGR